MFRYETLNGTAQRDSHYIYKCETLVFQPGETHKILNIDIINGAREWKRRDMFYVKLELDTIMTDEKIRIGQSNPAEILYPAWERDSVEVEFAKSNTVVRENDGIVRLPIVRKGAIKVRIVSIFDFSQKSRWRDLAGFYQQKSRFPRNFFTITNKVKNQQAEWIFENFNIKAGKPIKI